MAANDPILALSDFKPNFYDLLLVDIDMPRINGFELFGRKVASKCSERKRSFYVLDVLEEWIMINGKPKRIMHSSVIIIHYYKF